MSDMGCSCSCDLEYGEHEEWAQQVKARKRHTCCECGDNIEPGEMYEKFTLMFEGSFSHFKMCTVCKRIAKSLCPCGYTVGELRETIYEELDVDYLGKWPDKYEEDEDE